ncbi:MAG: TetR/AcrR family transcriptional regulator [Bacteroidia bacterium]|nr:TetR/AcrR family transcriptional regulator [Bacteroidia bacterium]
MAEIPTPNPVRTKILDLCLEAFNQDGYRKVSMDLVCRQLKISKKTIYRHFKSKEEILEEILREQLREIESKSDHSVTKNPALQDLNTLSELYFTFLDSLSGTLLGEISESLPHLTSWIDLSEKQAFREPFRKILRALRNEGSIFFTMNSRELTDAIFGMLRGIHPLPADQRTLVYSLAFAGLAKSEPAKKSGRSREKEAAEPEKTKKSGRKKNK